MDRWLRSRLRVIRPAATACRPKAQAGGGYESWLRWARLNVAFDGWLNYFVVSEIFKHVYVF
jgi:hypothetical protein